jgi:diguanylate cyclase (GGDEF)-like protein
MPRYVVAGCLDIDGSRPARIMTVQVSGNDDSMESTSEQRDSSNAEAEIARDWDTNEARLAWFAGVVTVALAGLAIAFVVVTQASSAWHYIGDGLLVALPLLFGIPMAVYIHHRRVSRLQRTQDLMLRSTAELRETASRDELTDLYNRRYFYKRLQEELDRGRLTKQPVALLALDVDGLKVINDEYGHQVGDIVLRNFAEVLAEQARSGDVPGRLGGDEFGVIMPDTGKRGAYALARRLWQELEEKPIYSAGNVTIYLGVSIGIAGFPWSGETIDQLTCSADTDMYTNKVSQRLPSVSLEEAAAPNIDAAPSEYP